VGPAFVFLQPQNVQVFSSGGEGDDERIGVPVVMGLFFLSPAFSV
jgi:hypothetical protein